MTEVRRLPSFTLECGKLYVTDPCYTKDGDPDSVVVVENALNGTWISSVELVPDEMPRGSEFKRVKSLSVERQGSVDESGWSTLVVGANVDSGQLGIFCYNSFPSQPGNYSDPTSFYGRACALTLEETAGTLQGVGKGVVSSSGYGDGTYDVFVHRNKAGECYAIDVQFIGHEEDQGPDSPELWS